MNVFSRSWSVTKMSFSVVLQDPELLLFPAISAVFSVLFSLAMIFPAFIAVWLEGGDVAFGPLQLAASFATYFGLAFFATFSNVCVVHTTRTRLNGGDATFMESISFAMSRLPHILGWSLVSASVGVVLRVLQRAARRGGFVGRFVAQMLLSMLGMAWSVVSLFVVPAMVYDNIGPIDALKRSTEVLKRTWGESLVRYYGLTVMTFIGSLPGVLVIIGGIVAFSVSAKLAIALMVAGGLWIAAAVFVFGLLNSVYNVSLFHYATQGQQAPEGFDVRALQGAFQ